jgi:hypothetical protein
LANSDAQIETNYVRLGDNEEETSSTFNLKPQVDQEDNDGEILPENKDYTGFDCVVVVHDPSSGEKQFFKTCEFIKLISAVEFEVKILFLNLESSKLDTYDTETLFEKTESFIEVVS